MARRIADRVRYRARIQSIISKLPTRPDDIAFELQVQAHWAKYSCVLISGFIEQAIKELLLEHASGKAAPRIRKYVEGTWPSSRNMRCDAISDILSHFDDGWATEFDSWIKKKERKKEINEIIKWRNDIAHGKEANTNNVTISSVEKKFSIACDLVDFLENLAQDAA